MTIRLTPKQERFCQYYVTDPTIYGNATLSYAAAYNIDLTPSKNLLGEVMQNPNYDNCSAYASRMLRISKIQARILELYDQYFTESRVDMELFKVIRQDWKLEPKVAAIREFNKLRKRIVDKVEHSGKIQTETTPNEAVAAAIKQYEATREQQIREETKAMK